MDNRERRYGVPLRNLTCEAGSPVPRSRIWTIYWTVNNRRTITTISLSPGQLCLCRVANTGVSDRCSWPIAGAIANCGNLALIVHSFYA